MDEPVAHDIVYVLHTFVKDECLFTTSGLLHTSGYRNGKTETATKFFSAVNVHRIQHTPINAHQHTIQPIRP